MYIIKHYAVIITLHKDLADIYCFHKIAKKEYPYTFTTYRSTNKQPYVTVMVELSINVNFAYVCMCFQ